LAGAWFREGRGALVPPEPLHASFNNCSVLRGWYNGGMKVLKANRERMLTVSEAANSLGVTESTLAAFWKWSYPRAKAGQDCMVYSRVGT